MGLYSDHEKWTAAMRTDSSPNTFVWCPLPNDRDLVHHPDRSDHRVGLVTTLEDDLANDQSGDNGGGRTPPSSPLPRHRVAGRQHRDQLDQTEVLPRDREDVLGKTTG